MLLLYTVLNANQQCKHVHVIVGLAAFAGTEPCTNDIRLELIIIAQAPRTSLANVNVTILPVADTGNHSIFNP